MGQPSQSPMSMVALIVAGEAIFALPFVLPRVFRPALLSTFGIDNTTLGSAFSIYGLVAMAAYLFGGPLADLVSARRMMSAALVATAAGGLVFATFPGPNGLMMLYGFWGLTTILLFWSGMLKATRLWGGPDRQGRAYGLLDGGRGLCAAVLSTLAVAVFASRLGDDVTPEARAEAFRLVILCTSGLTVVAAAAVAYWVPDSPPSTRERWNVGALVSLLKRPITWAHGVIIVCAYAGYKGTDDLSLLATDALGYDDVEAAVVGTIAFWLRPIAAIGAGFLAERFSGHRVVAWCFALLVASNLAVVLSTVGPIEAALFASIVSTVVSVYALRGVYFVLTAESRVPVAWTGTAIGLVSVVGYTPDVFMGPLMGRLLDGYPGILGHQYLFAVLAGFAAMGACASVGFARWIPVDVPLVDYPNNTP